MFAAQDVEEELWLEYLKMVAGKPKWVSLEWDSFC
jgi:hypothetical protein